MAVLKYLGKDKKYHALPIGESIDIVQYDEYSTDETIVGKWINGKPIYRKVIPFTFPSSSGLTAFENVLIWMYLEIFHFIYHQMIMYQSM